MVEIELGNFDEAITACETSIAIAIELGNHDIAATAKNAGTFKTLLAAAKAAGLVGPLTGDDDLTVFAPTDDAFAKLPEGTVESLLKPENKKMLQQIILYHVVAGRVYSEKVVGMDSAPTLAKMNVKISAGDAGVTSQNHPPSEDRSM